MNKTPLYNDSSLDSFGTRELIEYIEKLQNEIRYLRQKVK